MQLLRVRKSADEKLDHEAYSTTARTITTSYDI
jgi:hypothetical protein